MFNNSVDLRRFGALVGLLLSACGDDAPAESDGTLMTSTISGTTSPADTSTSTISPTDTGVLPTTGNSGAMTTGTVEPMTTSGTTMGPTTQTTESTSTGSMTTEDTTTGGMTSASTSTSTSVGEESSTGEFCPQGTLICEDNVSKECDGMGGFASETPCDPQVCVPDEGCLVCLPGSAMCEGEISKICNAEGSGYDDVFCDSVQGMSCDANSGLCVGVCSPIELGQSYIGCEYYPTVTANIVANNFHFAAAVANATGQPANILIERAGMTVVMDTVLANSVKVFNLPWVPGLKGDQNTPSSLVADGAFRLRSNRPVTVYQYSPIEYTLGGNSFSFTNDASLLLPTNTWTGNYFVAARNQWVYFGSQYPGFYAVTASQDNTQVTLTPSATGGSVKPGGGVAGNGTGNIVLNQGDVLEVFGTSNSQANPNPVDLTGTQVIADKPIQVISGHLCTFIPHDIGYCDHLEESVPPFETLAREILVTPPLIPTGGNTPKAQMVRIIATEAGTTLTYDPPQNGAPSMLANPGDYSEISQTANDFKITSNNKILVMQYMLGQDAGGNSGDPAMAMAVPIEQFRTSYLFHAPLNYEKNYMNIVAPTGANVTLDGGAVNGFAAIGGTGFGVARVPLPNNADGTHDISSDQKIGISVYGYGQYTSYWYPGGLDLATIPQ